LPGTVHDPGRDGKFSRCSTPFSPTLGSSLCSPVSGCPKKNSIMEQRVQTCRCELLDRTLIWNQRHLLQALHEFERFYNGHRPHQGIANAGPLHPLPTPIADPHKLAHLNVRRRDRLGGILHEYQHAA
jgi:putative transposase